MTNKSCPHCHNEILDVTHYHGEELDVCRQCAGVWFEEGQLNAVISQVDNGEDDSNYKQLLGDKLTKTKLACPNGCSKLECFSLLNSYDVEIDICRVCDGVWIDFDELEKVEHSPRIRQALDDLNKSVSVKSWLFQMLSRFPVEYNLKPHRTPWVTYALVLVNCLIFLGYAVQPEMAEWVFSHFASSPQDISRGTELWTPLTATFLHGGWMHLLGNMYFLFVIGDNLEDVLGRWRFLGLYLFSGVAASLISVAFNWGSPIQSVGASGAIAALFGMYLIWFRFASLSFMFVFYQKKLSAVWYFAIWLVLDNVWSMVSGVQGIDYWAHIGGLAVGVALGLLLKPFVYRRNPVVRFLAEESVTIKR